MYRYDFVIKMNFSLSNLSCIMVEIHFKRLVLKKSQIFDIYRQKNHKNVVIDLKTPNGREKNR